jgi:NAD(P)-dependent dehydrogenase (short-subunit alcohol dehydrogenase family)
VEEIDMENHCLKGKIALVTGSRRGIGRAIALALARAGADVAVCDLITNDGKLNSVAKEIRGFGSRTLAIQTDISHQTEIEKMAELILVQFGKIDILVNCAGVWIPGHMLIECTEENWDKVIDTNLKGTYLCCKSIGKLMTKQMSGSIINLSSQVGLDPGVGIGAYSISKAGIIMLTRQLALELARYKIRVNALAPGVVKTDFNANIWDSPEKEKRIASSIPLGRLAEPEDIADSAVFLASDASGYITGEVISINGGWQPRVT